MITSHFPWGPWPFSLIFYIAKQTTKKVCMQTWIPLQPNLIVLSSFFVLIALLLWLLYFAIYCMYIYWFNHWEHATFEKYLCCAIRFFFFFWGGVSVSLFAFLLLFFFFFFLMCLIVKILNLTITDEDVSKSTLRDLNARDLSKQAESCNAQCGKILKGPSSLKV